MTYNTSITSITNFLKSLSTLTTFKGIRNSYLPLGRPSKALKAKSDSESDDSTSKTQKRKAPKAVVGSLDPPLWQIRLQLQLRLDGSLDPQNF